MYVYILDCCIYLTSSTSTLVLWKLMCSYILCTMINVASIVVIYVLLARLDGQKKCSYTPRKRWYKSRLASQVISFEVPHSKP